MIIASGAESSTLLTRSGVSTAGRPRPIPFFLPEDQHRRKYCTAKQVGPVETPTRDAATPDSIEGELF
jgi:hypothetical protein